MNFVSDFELNVSRECSKQGYDGAICGHIHQAAIEHHESFIYMNCGDWVESCTALIEGVDGEFQIVDWLQPLSENNVVQLIPPKPETGPKLTDPGRHAA